MRPFFNRQPLQQNFLSPLAPGAVLPEGWLKNTMEKLADGIAADFDALMGEIGEDWIWDMSKDADLDRFVYYLEGSVGLGWTLKNSRYQEISSRITKGILRSQREDGWFGPEKNRNYWPRIHALRALRSCFLATADKEILKFMDRFFRYEARNLSSHPLNEWAVARGGENMELVLWMYNLTGQRFLLDLARVLRSQTLDWTGNFHSFQYEIPISRSMTWARMTEAIIEEKNEPLTGTTHPYFRTRFHFTNAVNNAMGLKTPGVINLFKSGIKEQDGFRVGWDRLMKNHGTANGIFTGDDALAGSSPTQVTHLQTIVEMMNTLETLIGIGDPCPELADILEKLAYNALPAAFNPEMNRYQALQQANQIRIANKDYNLYSASSQGLLFRRADRTEDCASCLQAWPGFVTSMWYNTQDGGVQAMSYAPCTVLFRAGDIPVRIHVSDGYPFREEITLTVSPRQDAEFPLYLRIPFWAEKASVRKPDGTVEPVPSGETACIRRTWSEGDTVVLTLPASARVSGWFHQSRSVEVGPLVMVYRPETEWSDTEAGMEAYAISSWAYSLLQDEDMKIRRNEDTAPESGKEKYSVEVNLKAARISWPMDKQYECCSQVPVAPHVTRSAVEYITLVPYGEASLRITSFPVSKAPEKHPAVPKLPG